MLPLPLFSTLTTILPFPLPLPLLLPQPSTEHDHPITTHPTPQPTLNYIPPWPPKGMMGGVLPPASGSSSPSSEPTSPPPQTLNLNNDTGSSPVGRNGPSISILAMQRLERGLVLGYACWQRVRRTGILPEPPHLPQMKPSPRSS